jgi:hypothetical protein
MAIPTADLRRPRLDLPTIKRSPKDGFEHGSVPSPQTTRADSETGLDSLAALRPHQTPEP